MAYSNEYVGYDCSIDDDIHFYLPSKKLVDELGLHWRGQEGHLYDSEGKLAAFDPSVCKKGPSALLIRQHLLDRYLKDNGLDILWAIDGQKYLISGGMGARAVKSKLNVLIVCRVVNDKIEHTECTRFHG